MKKIVEKKLESVQGFVSLSALNLLTQQRKEPKGIPEFADALGSVPLRGSPLWVNKLTTFKKAQEYLKRLNVIFAYRNAKHRVAELITTIEDGRRVFYVLIAGHRRTLALRRVQSGLTKTLANRYPDCPADEAFARDYPYGIEAIIYINLSADEAIALQAIENQRVAVDPRDELDLTMAQWKLARGENPKLTIAAFARMIGMSPSTASARVRFHELASTAQDAVYAEVLSLEHGSVMLQAQSEWLKIESTRVFTGVIQKMLSDDSEEKLRQQLVKKLLVFAGDLLIFDRNILDYVGEFDLTDTQQAELDQAVRNEASRLRGFITQHILMAGEHFPRRMPLKTFKHCVRRNLSDVTSGQGDLFAEMEKTASHAITIEKTSRRMRNQQVTLGCLREVIGWIQRVTWLKSVGLIDQESESWRDEQVKQAFARMLDAVEGVVGLLSSFIGVEQATRADVIVTEGRLALRELG